MDALKLEKKQSYTLILVCFLTYVFSQITKSAMSANATAIMADYGQSHANVGLITSIFMICYGFGQIVNGFFCVKYNKKIVVTASLIISCLVTLTMFFPVPFWLIYILWAINGLAHSTLWLLLLLKLNQTLSKKYMLKAGLVMGLASMGGAFLSYGTCTIFSKLNFYRGSFLTAAIAILISIAIWVTYSVVDPKIEKTEAVTEEEKKEVVEDHEMEGSSKKVAFLIIFFAILSFTSFGIASGFKSWAPNMMKELYNLEDWFSILISLLLPACAVFNTTLSIKTYKKTKNFNTVAIIYFGLAIIFSVLLIIFFNVHWAVALTLFVFISVSCGAVTNALTVQVPLSLANKKINSGMLAGILNGAGYLGSASTSYILGAIADNTSWDGVFVFCLIVTIVSFVMAVTYGLVAHFINKKKKDEAVL